MPSGLASVIESSRILRVRDSITTGTTEYVISTKRKLFKRPSSYKPPTIIYKVNDSRAGQTEIERINWGPSYCELLYQSKPFEWVGYRCIVYFC
jgi:hypothetical protein